MATGSFVRRLTPPECERLQAFHHDAILAIISVCRGLADGGSTHNADAVGRWPADPADASLADEAASPLDASPVAGSFSTHPHGHGKPARLAVRIDFGLNVLVISSPGAYRRFAADADASASYPLPTELARTVLALARLRRDEAQAIQRGAEALLTSDALSSPLGTGPRRVVLSGDEIGTDAGAVIDGESAMSMDGRPTTSAHGHDSPTSGSTWRTLCCSAAHVISSFIPRPIRNGFSYEYELRVVNDGWTCTETDNLGLMSDGEPYAAERCTCPDSPRYRSLGNAVTTTVAQWFGARLATAILEEEMRNEE